MWQSLSTLRLVMQTNSLLHSYTNIPYRVVFTTFANSLSTTSVLAHTHYQYFGRRCFALQSVGAIGRISLSIYEGATLLSALQKLSATFTSWNSENRIDRYVSCWWNAVWESVYLYSSGKYTFSLSYRRWSSIHSSWKINWRLKNRSIRSDSHIYRC